MRVLKWLISLFLLFQVPFLYALYQSYRLRQYLASWPRPGVETPAPFRDLRGGIHVHSMAGGHSLGTYPEIIEAARQAGYHYLFITEHPRSPPLFLPIEDAEILVIYGSEEDRGLFRVLSDRNQRVSFLTHLEADRVEGGFTGVEIFNLHESSQGKDTWYNRTQFLYHSFWFPEMFFFHLWELDPYRLALWENALQEGSLTAIAGNDAHQNVGVIVQTASGRKIFSLIADPYLESLRFVTTHVLLAGQAEVSEESILAALQQGSAYVAFERIADPTGFSFHALEENKVLPMGARARPGAELVFQSPSPVRFVVIRNASTYKELEGRRFIMKTSEAGIYRVEAYPLDPPALLQGKPWIISNPIFVR